MIIDLDANATTNMDREVKMAFDGALARTVGNASSDNRLGSEARILVETARSQIADLIGAQADEIIFLPSATAAINLGIRGLSSSLRPDHKPRILVSRGEHMAVIRTVNSLRIDALAEISPIRIDRRGTVELADTKKALNRRCHLLCVIHGNNEIGTINPLRELVDLAKDNGVAVFVDAAQTGGYCPPKVDEIPIDLMCISAHKMHGPLGVAALFVRHGVKLNPILYGGGQERGLWPGTLNVPAIVGFGIAARLAQSEAGIRAEKVRELRNTLLEELKKWIPDLQLNGHPVDRLPSNLNLTLPFVPAQILQRRNPSIAFSRGSACTSQSEGASHVLRAIGLSADEARWTIRLGVSKDSYMDEVKEAGRLLGATAKKLRGE